MVLVVYQTMRISIKTIKQHYPFPISDITTIQLTVDKPTVIVEFYQENQTW